MRANLLRSRRLAGRFYTTPKQWISQSSRNYSDTSSNSTRTTGDEALKSTAKPTEHVKPKKKTQAELDREVQLKLQGLSGDGGDAGVEYEDGKPVSMKRSVKNNMFRYI
ncbi:Nn.00g017300.m01.CDS01 [Neocucurbitaria sp. VM-36]